MRKRLKPGVIEILSKRLNKTPDKIRPRLSEIRRTHSGLTLNAAAQFYAQQHGISIMAKLNDEDRQSLGSTQAISQINSSKTIKIDKRTLNINNSPIHNLSFGDRNTLSQSVVSLDDNLAKLFEKINNSEVLTDEEKNDYKSDMQTIAAQIGKAKPSRQIIKMAWESVKTLVTIEGFAQVIDRITPLMQRFLFR